jgi:NADH-quinone oxidoreductase subunit J
MMLNMGSQTTHQEKLWLNSSAWAIPALLSFLIGLTLVWMLSSGHMSAPLGKPVGPKEVGISLFGPYLLLVEVAALLLLAALVAAFHLGKKHPLEDDVNNEVQP